MRIQVLVQRAAARSIALVGIVGHVRGARFVRGMRASVRERGLQNERPSRVCGKGLANSIDLSLQLGHGPHLHHLFHDAHMAGEELSGIRVEVWVGGDDGNLDELVECLRAVEEVTYEMDDDTGQASVDGEGEAPLHALETRKTKIADDGFLQSANGLGSVVALKHVPFPLNAVSIGVQERQLRSII